MPLVFDLTSLFSCHHLLHCCHQFSITSDLSCSILPPSQISGSHRLRPWGAFHCSACVFVSRINSRSVYTHGPCIQNLLLNHKFRLGLIWITENPGLIRAKVWERWTQTAAVTKTCSDCIEPLHLSPKPDLTHLLLLYCIIVSFGHWKRLSRL